MKKKHAPLPVNISMLTPYSLHKTRSQLVKDVEIIIPKYAFLFVVYQSNYIHIIFLCTYQIIKNHEIQIYDCLNRSSMRALQLYNGNWKLKFDLKLSISESPIFRFYCIMNGRTVLNGFINREVEKLLLILKQHSMTPSGTSESVSSFSSKIVIPKDPAKSSSSAVTPSSTESKLRSYIKKCISEVKRHGFNLQTQIHEVIACDNVILLRKGKQSTELRKYIDADSLLTSTASAALDKKIKVDESTYSKLAETLRDLDETSNRRAIKIKLDEIYAEASEEDGNIIEIFSNLVKKLPNQERFSHIGEMELIVNFLDPVLSPICHCPNKNRLLVWLNRQDENTALSKPDATMMASENQAIDVTLGYVEVKPADSESNPELGFADLVRLGTFGRTLMLRKSNKKVLCIQCIGYSIVFYLVSELNGVTLMTDILKLKIPATIAEVCGLLQKVDDLKRLSSLYECQVESRYSSALSLDDKQSSTWKMSTRNARSKK